MVRTGKDIWNFYNRTQTNVNSHPIQHYVCQMQQFKALQLLVLLDFTTFLFLPPIKSTFLNFSCNVFGFQYQNFNSKY